MEHQQDRIHILLIKYGQIMDLFLIGEQAFDRLQDLRLFADLHDHKKPGYEAFRKQETGLVIRIQVPELGHKSFHEIGSRNPEPAGQN